ncbi:MAG: ExbD/TolR family protein [Pyrinomonadaceae bacterium]
MRDAVPSVNVTPLIDILLVLLIIFMVITPLKPARFKALVPQPPEKINEDAGISPKTLIVSVGPDLSLKLLMGEDVVAEGSVGEAGEVAARLASEWRERKLAGTWKSELAARTDLPPDERIERTVFVRAPRSVRYGEVARVIDAVKGAGAQPVGLQTDALPQ